MFGWIESMLTREWASVSSTSTAAWESFQMCKSLVCSLLVNVVSLCSGDTQQQAHCVFAANSLQCSDLSKCCIHYTHIHLCSYCNMGLNVILLLFYMFLHRNNSTVNETESISSLTVFLSTLVFNAALFSFKRRLNINPGLS